MPVDPDELIAFAGDWHGNKPFALDTIGALADRGVRRIIHCGDFGLWPGRGGKHYVRDLNALLVERDVSLAVVPGNHDDWDQISRLHLDADGFGTIVRGVPEGVQSRIFCASRGARWEWGGLRFAGFGGAVSVDREMRRTGRDWWPQETARPEDVTRLAGGGPVDVLVCHDRPIGAPITLPARKLGWPPYLLELADEHRRLLQTAVDAVTPSVIVHGHYHLDVRGPVDMAHGPVHVVGLDCDEATIAANTWVVSAAELADLTGAHHD